MKKRGLTFAELLIALAILALVICGATVFLQSNLIFYRHQIAAVRAAFLGQQLLNTLPIASQPIQGQIEDFLYAAEFESTSQPEGAWIHLTFLQGKTKILKQSLWRSQQSRWVSVKNFEQGDWQQIEVDGLGQITGRVQERIATTDGQSLFWQGSKVYQSQQAFILEPRANPEGTQIAFLQQQGAETGVWVLDVTTRKATCWRSGDSITDPPCWLPDGDLLVCRGNQLVRLSKTYQRTLYEGPGQWLSSPTVSPEGGRVCFVCNPKEGNELYLLDLQTGKAKNISNSPEGEIRPLWSPHGERILFGIAPSAGGSHLACIHPDGSGRQDLQVIGSGNDWHWNP